MTAMTTRHALIALTSAVVVLGAAACGTSNTPIAITTPGQPTPVGVARSACTDLGGAIDSNRICNVHDAKPGYVVSFTFPDDYPDQQAVTAALTKQRDQFVELVGERPTRDRPYELTITGTAYRSEASGTQSLVFKEFNDTGGAHPETYYEALDYDVGKGVPITLDTLFKPGTDPVGVLDPIVAPELAKRVGGDANDNVVGAEVYQNFAITDDAVIFFIGQGMWLIEAAGPQEVSVPRAQLDTVLTLPRVGGGAPPCASGQVSVTAGKSTSAATHRATQLVFSLVDGANACTLTGYPGVDSGAGGPLIHATRTVSGYLGGVPAGVPTTVTVSPFQPVHAVLEGDAVDAGGNPCPTYTDLLVTAPDTTSTGTVAATIDACALEIHPVGSDF